MSRGGTIKDSDLLDGFSVTYLKFFRIWSIVNHYRETGEKSKIFKVQLTITLLLAVPYLLFQYSSYFIIVIDIQKIIFLSLHTLPALQICCKILVFWFRLDSQCKLYSLVRKDFLFPPVDISDEAKKIYQKISLQTNRFITIALIVDASIVSLNVLVPEIPVDYITKHTGNMLLVTEGRKKILCAWYPLPLGETPYFEALYVYEFVVISWIGIHLGVYVCLFYQVLMCLCAQYQVLSLRVSNLKIDPYVDYRKENWRIYQELCQIVKHHQKLLNYTEELRSVYNPLVTMILGTGISVLVISVFLFLFVGAGTPLFMFKSLQFLAYQAIDASMFCFGSSAIESASSDLQFAIYRSDWYKADTRFRKMAQMVMVRSMKPVTLTAINVYPVNAATILNMLQFTYSVAALISRLAE